MDTLYLLNNTKISRHDNTLRVAPAEGKARNFPVETLKHIIVIGSTTFNTELATFLGKNSVRVSFLDFYGNFSGSLEAATLHASGAVHLAQARIILEEEKRLALAKLILGGASQNLLNNLRYYSYRGKEEVKPIIEEIQAHRTSLLAAKSIEQLMGHEGMARQTYYSAWGLINPLLKIEKRTRQPPTDRINALISFCNGLVYSVCKHQLSQTHLDLTLSFIHAPTQARASLSLDLAEIFKPIIADKQLIFGMINRHMLEDGDFDEQAGICLLSEKGRRKVVEEFREKMDKEEIEGMRGWRAVILREAFRLQAHVLGMEAYSPYIHKV